MRIVWVVLTALLLSSCQTAPPADRSRAEVAAMMQKWADAMTRHDVEAVVALYDSDAVLWGTRSPTIRAQPTAVREYFNVLHRVPPTYKATLGDNHIRVYGDIAVASGSYTFSEVHDGKEVLRPARFSMVYRHHDGRWWIVDHHSSAVPAP